MTLKDVAIQLLQEYTGSSKIQARLWVLDAMRYMGCPKNFHADIEDGQLEGSDADRENLKFMICLWANRGVSMANRREERYLKWKREKAQA